MTETRKQLWLKTGEDKEFSPFIVNVCYDLCRKFSYVQLCIFAGCTTIFV